MAGQLRKLLHELISRENIAAERIVVLSPYRLEHNKSSWRNGLEQVVTTGEMSMPTSGKVRVGTIQGFKGLEADVVILAGIDRQSAAHHDWLYIGASRARALLHVLAFAGICLHGGI